MNLGHVNEFRPDLLDMLTLRPVEYLPLFEQVRVQTSYNGTWYSGIYRVHYIIVVSCKLYTLLKCWSTVSTEYTISLWCRASCIRYSNVGERYMVAGKFHWACLCAVGLSWPVVAAATLERWYVSQLLLSALEAQLVPGYLLSI